MGKSKRDEEHLLAVRGWTRSARARSKTSPSWGRVKTVRSRRWELEASTEIDTLVTSQKCITNHAAYPTLHRMHFGHKAAISNTINWIKGVAAAESACYVADNVLSCGSVQEMESSMSVEATRRTVVKEEMNTDQIVESDGEAPCQLEQSQIKYMKVSVDRGGTTTTATVQRVRQGHNGLQT